MRPLYSWSQQQRTVAAICSGLLILVSIVYLNRLIIMYINKRKRREKRIRIALIAKRRKQRANRFRLLVEEILKGVAAITSYKFSFYQCDYIYQHRHNVSIMPFPTEELTTSQLVPAFVAAFSVFSILTIFSCVSVVHMNPTVTFALFFAGVFDVKLVLPYIVAQLLGALVGASLAMAGAGYGDAIGAVHLPVHMTSVQLSSLIVTETQLSFLLVFAITMVVANRHWTMPTGTLIYGGTVFTGVMCGQLNGAGILNPARVFGPAVLSGDWSQHWVWWVTSLMAAIQSALLHQCIFAQHEHLLPPLRKRIKEPESN